MNSFNRPLIGKELKLSIAAIIFVLVTGMLAFFMVGHNPADHRTIVQYPTGELKVVSEQGLYLRAFGKVTVYEVKDTIKAEKET